MALACHVDESMFTPQFVRCLPSELRKLLPSNFQGCAETAERGFETCIWADAHVDGVQFFENSTNKSVSGALTCSWNFVLFLHRIQCRAYVYLCLL